VAVLVVVVLVAAAAAEHFASINCQPGGKLSLNCNAYTVREGER